MMIDIDLIDLGDNASRQEVGDCSELALAISKYGQLQPVLVRKNGERYTLVAGFRRYHAMRYYLQRTRIYVRFEAGQARDDTLNLVENLHRSNLTYWEECLAVRKAFRKSQSISEIARELGKSRNWVRVRHCIWDLSKDILQKIEQGDLSPKQVAQLLEGTPSARTQSIKNRHKPTEKEIRAAATRLLADGRDDAAKALTYALGDIALENLLP